MSNVWQRARGVLGINALLRESARLGKKRICWEVACNLFLMGLFGCFAARFLHDFLAFYRFDSFQAIFSIRLSSILAILSMSIYTVLFLIRKFPKEVSFSPYDWLVAGVWRPESPWTALRRR